MWFIAYHHMVRQGEAGIKFVQSEGEAIAEKQRLEQLGYIATKIAPTSKTRMDAFLAGTLTDPEHPLLG